MKDQTALRTVVDAVLGPERRETERAGFSGVLRSGRSDVNLEVEGDFPGVGGRIRPEQIAGIQQERSGNGDVVDAEGGLALVGEEEETGAREIRDHREEEGRIFGPRPEPGRERARRSRRMQEMEREAFTRGRRRDRSFHRGARLKRPGRSGPGLSF
jgi:hypothetical protein